MRFLVIFGLVVLVVGLARPWLSRLGIGLMPGNINIGRGRFSIHFPIMTSMIISVVLSVLLTLLNQ